MRAACPCWMPNGSLLRLPKVPRSSMASVRISRSVEAVPDQHAADLFDLELPVRQGRRDGREIGQPRTAAQQYAGRRRAADGQRPVDLQPVDAQDLGQAAEGAGRRRQRPRQSLAGQLVGHRERIEFDPRLRLRPVGELLVAQRVQVFQAARPRRVGGDLQGAIVDIVGDDLAGADPAGIRRVGQHGQQAVIVGAAVLGRSRRRKRQSGHDNNNKTERVSVAHRRPPVAIAWRGTGMRLLRIRLIFR